MTEERTKDIFEAFEALVDAAPTARNYFSDAFVTWGASWYPGKYQALTDKSQTYSVEADNAELRHYLARLARKSRCFSRCIEALRRAVDVFVRAWNARQSAKRSHPKLPVHVADFVTL